MKTGSTSRKLEGRVEKPKFKGQRPQIQGEERRRGGVYPREFTGHCAGMIEERESLNRGKKSRALSRRSGL